MKVKLLPFLWILGITLLVSGSAYGIYFFHLDQGLSKRQDSRYQITSIVQTGEDCDALNTNFLAELLGLSADSQTNLFQFDLKKAHEKIAMCPLIKEAEVKRLRPSAVYIDYTIRKPMALLYDYENIAIDEEGFLFPAEPFFPTRNLPEIYLGLKQILNPEKEFIWYEPMQGKELALSFKILSLLTKPPFSESFLVKRIDVSRAFHKSQGKKEIILLLEERVKIKKDGKTTFIFPKILRLNPKGIEQQLSNFLVLQNKMHKDYYTQLISKAWTSSEIRFQPKIVDFRIPTLAYVQKND
ncbi:MAG TPA: FtsQ-type POTRA domain-containing protein [Chlamydiales bacterium]|nr:FtsQ-type POTRA domain-containing protein [Chlamydiales bacterium]